MNDKRWAEIAQKIIGHLVRKNGIMLSSNSKRELKDLAKRLDIPLEELQQFAKPFVQEILDEAYGE